MSASALALTHAADALQITEYLWLKLTHLVLVKIERGHALEQKVGGPGVPARQLAQLANR